MFARLQISNSSVQKADLFTQLPWQWYSTHYHTRQNNDHVTGKKQRKQARETGVEQDLGGKLFL